ALPQRVRGQALPAVRGRHRVSLHRTAHVQRDDDALGTELFQPAGDAVRIVDGQAADDATGDAGGQPSLDGRMPAQAAAELHDGVSRVHHRADDCFVALPTVAGAVQVDHVQMREAGAPEV